VTCCHDHHISNVRRLTAPAPLQKILAEDERFERSCRIAATIGLANRAVKPTPAIFQETVAEGRGFEPLRPGSQDITDFKSGAISRSANLPKKWSG
jgi:hypothetical protein